MFKQFEGVFLNLNILIALFKLIFVFSYEHPHFYLKILTLTNSLLLGTTIKIQAAMGIREKM